MAKKALTVWIFSSFTLMAILHLIDAASALFFGNPMNLLRLYPLASERLQAMQPSAYFWLSAAATFLLWGITCMIAFENPVEVFLNKILSDAKTQGAVETQLLESKGEILDAMFETIESSNQTLAQVKDIVHNVRVEAKEIQPLKESMERIRTEVGSLRKEIRKVEERMRFPNLCPVCGKSLMPEFNSCPYCGEKVRLQSPAVIAIKAFK